MKAAADCHEKGSYLKTSLIKIVQLKIHHQISVYALMIVDFGRALGISKVLDVRRRKEKRPKATQQMAL